MNPMDFNYDRQRIHDLVNNETDPQTLERVQTLLEVRNKEEAWNKILSESAIKAKADIEVGNLYAEDEFWNLAQKEFERGDD